MGPRGTGVRRVLLRGAKGRGRAIPQKQKPEAIVAPAPVAPRSVPNAAKAATRARGGAGRAMADAEREVLLTAEGLRKLEEELELLRTDRRKEVAERIKVAREFGDLSENAEYEAAKNEQAFVESRILSLETLLRNARIVQDSDVDPRRVNLGTTVTLRDLDSGELEEYTIVGSSEADPLNNRISYECPVGKSVFGQGAGSTVEVRLPNGTVRYEIVALSR
jgi:transcription elongation factor GreA